MQCSTEATQRPRDGRGHVVARARDDGRTIVTSSQATSPLRFTRPTFPGSRAGAVCLITFGGGLVDGDAIDVHVRVERGATLVVFTQATTKAFRGSTSQALRADVEGTLVLLPDPVACFAGARYRQRVDVTLEGEGSAVLLDGFTSGRPAYGERWAFSAIDLSTTVRRGDRVIVRDALRLEAGALEVAPRMDRFEALATLIAAGPRVETIMRGLLDPSVCTRDLVAAPSALSRPGEAAAIARIAATSPSAALDEARRRLRNLPDIDVVDPFVSRY
ncbi:MAG: urease accessory protein UreD [Labilithrix sp.]|nr:urease accessory protein UreD [Labilithrix sp.]